MKTVLNYSDRTLGNRRGTALGMASMGIAIAVLVVPLIVVMSGLGMQKYLSTPRLGTSSTALSMALLMVPALAMIVLPVSGLMLGAMGIRMGTRECQYAIVGMLVNAAALLAGVLVMFV